MIRKRVYLAALCVSTLVQLRLVCAQEVAGHRDDENAGTDRGDSWKTSTSPTPDRESCRQIDSALVVPVAKPERAEAISELSTSPVVPISAESAAIFTGAERHGDASSFLISGEGLIKSEIERLRKKRDLQLTENSGGWSRAEQYRLDDLLKLSRDSNLSNLTPFLARAVASNESTGGFAVSICRSVLWISHASLGASDAVPTRAPVVVFLDVRPATLYLSVGTAR